MSEQTLRTPQDDPDGPHGPDEPHRPVAVRLDLFAVRVPISALARSAMDESDNGLGMALDAEEPWEAGDFAFARLVDEDGTEGWGEVFMWLPETGVSSTEVLSTIVGSLGRYVVGSRPADVRAIGARMDRNVSRNEVAKGLIDLACHDLAARQVGRPVHDLVGGRGTDTLGLCGLVPLGSPEDVASLCAGYVGAGYRTLRLKLGTGIEADREVIAAVRAAVGDEVRLRVDYNQAYSVPQAIRALTSLEPYGIDAAEQPLAIDDLLGMVELARRTSIPVFLHEGAFSTRDLVTLIELGGCGVLGINAERPGGLTAALDMIGYAALRGLGTIIHNQPLGVGTAVLAHLAAARYDRLGHDVELAGDVMFDETLVVSPPSRSRGRLQVPTGPGWGVEVDRDALDRYTTAQASITIDDVRAARGGSAR